MWSFIGHEMVRNSKLQEKVKKLKIQLSVNVGDKTVVKYGSYKLLKDFLAELNGYARPSSIQRVRKHQIEKAQRMQH